MTTTLRTVPVGEVSADDEARWRRLAATACEPNPHLEPDYLLPFARADRDLEAALQFVEVDGELVLCALVAPERRPLGPLSYAALSTSSDFGEREMARTHPLVSAVNPAGAVGAWFDALARVAGPRIVWVRGMFADGAVSAAIVAAADMRGIPTVRHGHGYAPYARSGEWVPPAAAEQGLLFDAPHVPGHARREHHRCLRRLTEALGVTPVWEDRTAQPGAVQDFIGLQVAGWKGRSERGGTAFGLTEQRSAALVEVTERYGAEGRLVIGALAAEGRPLYMAVSLRSVWGTWAMPFDAFDEEFRALGVGKLGRLAWFNHVAFKWPDADIDPCASTSDPNILAQFPAQRPLEGVLLGTGGVSQRMIVRAVRSRERAH